MNASIPTPQTKPRRSPFTPLFWLVIVFEFFERGSYYGMMSFLSDYLTRDLGFAKLDVGYIKAVIQPLLYFLPIISGALADRFGYRRTLMVAFSLLGGGYLLTSQSTQYATVFLALVVMGLGAGTFKPVISGSIARCTDATNSTLGFGVYYWSINLGAFLVPLILVPYLKNSVGPQWVIVAAAVGTGSMLLPTIFLFREPPAPVDDNAKPKTSLLQTLANAFEIIYSPFVLLHHMVGGSGAGKTVIVALLGLCFGIGGWRFAHPKTDSHAFSSRAYAEGQSATVVVRVERNQTEPQPFVVKQAASDGARTVMTIYKPGQLMAHATEALAALHKVDGLRWVDRDDLQRMVTDLQTMARLTVTIVRGQPEAFRLTRLGSGSYRLALADADRFEKHKTEIIARLAAVPDLAGLDPAKVREWVDAAQGRPFLLIYIGLLLAGSLILLRIQRRFKTATPTGQALLAASAAALLQGLIWSLFALGYLSLLAAIIYGLVSLPLVSLLSIESDDLPKYRDHFRFLLMIFIYSGFWVLYFQMFDSVLWYVKAYVDATSLNNAVNSFLALFGGDGQWFFDVEHVTVINAGTIILLQLVVSNIVKNTKALPTMVVGIGLGTLGMAILSISTGIWVFLAGIAIFSIGEMTAHPKFISYVGQTAPKSRVAMYMGYLFLYGVIGSGIGAPVGASLYVKFVDELNQPRTLWLIFAGIGIATIVGLLLYNMLAAKADEPSPRPGAADDEA